MSASTVLNYFEYVKEIDFHANVIIGLDLDRPDWEDTKDWFIEILCKLAREKDWEFALFHDDIFIMMYKNEQLVLNKLATYWKSEEALKSVTMPYVFKEILY